MVAQVRWDAKADNNQQTIIHAAKRFGCSILPLFRVGMGAPDLLLGYKGQNILVEIKTPSGVLNEKQTEWHASWKGQVAIVNSVYQLVTLLQKINTPPD